MIVIYFTGTGNSKYAAQRVAEIAGASDIIDAGAEIKAGRPAKIRDDDLVVAMPVYAWKMPEILENWLRASDIRVKRIWYIMTCGDQMGGADRYNSRISKDLGAEHMGTAEIIMPENYIAMFNAPFEEEAREIVKAAEGPIERAGETIARGEKLQPSRQAFIWKMGTSIVNPVFSKVFIKDKAFYSTDGCNGCGQCVELCPMNNIIMEGGRPEWMGNCIHCMACICYCPAEAIEYGKGSKGRFRYNIERLGL